MIAERKNPATLLEAMRHFDCETARRYLESIKWPQGAFCPKCGSVNVGTIASRNGMRQCREKGCRCQFSLIKGTIMEGTHLRLDQWCMAVWMIVNCKNGVSSCEIARSIGCKQQSAWHLLHRVRHLLEQDFSQPMGANNASAVECDSTFIGGLLKFMPYERQQRAMAKGKWGKSVVHAVKERQTGRVRAEVIDPDLEKTAKDFVREHVAPGTTVYTDSGSEYKWLTKGGYRHEAVNHKAMEYVRGSVHTNGLESYFNCVRRGLKGTYIATSPEHLQAYVDEQTFRFNHRHETDWERFSATMALVVGKRLTYETLTYGATR
jgi:transposase-like protein